MYCENCGRDGFTQAEMEVNQTTRRFIGPCCSRKSVAPPADQRLVYGLEFHSDTGLFAYMKYGGMTLTYSKPVQQLGEHVPSSPR